MDYREFRAWQRSMTLEHLGYLAVTMADPAKKPPQAATVSAARSRRRAAPETFPLLFPGSFAIVADTRAWYSLRVGVCGRGGLVSEQGTVAGAVPQVRFSTLSTGSAVDSFVWTRGWSPDPRRRRRVNRAGAHR